MRRTERIPKPEPQARAPSRQKAKGGAGAGAGVPLFLKRGQQGAALERRADDVAHAAKSGSAEASDRKFAPEGGARKSDMPATDAGAPLDDAMRSRIEPAVGEDLSRARVHQSAGDRELAGGMNARAFTQGSDIWLGPRESASDLELIAHESAHVVQQQSMSGPLPIQRQENPPGSTTTTTTGTPADLAAYLKNPKQEQDTTLQTEINMLDRYKPSVDVSKVEFQLMTTTASYVGAGLFEEGQSHWEGNKPIIQLTQDKYDTIAQHQAGTADVGEVHAVVRMVGHELFHLYREKQKFASNPLKPMFDAEAQKRMEQIHQNWVEFAKNPGGAKELNVPKGKTVTKWEDIPAAERKKIDTGATDTPQIQGLYERTAYLVEEIYDRIEELSYLRVEQKAENEAAAQNPANPPKRSSPAAVAEIAKLVYRLSTALDQSVGNDFMTQDVLEKTRKSMLDFLRNRYPHTANPKFDSYEVIFYLVARNSGIAPVYNDQGALLTSQPPEARVP
jgi:hypothetical protein